MPIEAQPKNALAADSTVNGVVGVLRAGWQNHFFAVKPRLFGVNGAIERCVLLTGNALAGVQHGIKRFTRVVRKSRALREVGGAQPIVEQKIEGGAQLRHPRILHGDSQAPRDDCHFSDPS